MPVRNSLTTEERRFISVAKVASSCEVDELIRIIERLSGEEITPADVNSNREAWGRQFDPWKDRQKVTSSSK